jgi:hypothetical protein
VEEAVGAAVPIILAGGTDQWTYTPARDPPSYPCFLFFERRRNTLEGGRTDAIRKVGPQFSFISEFWSKLSSPREYGGFDCGSDAGPRLQRQGA